MSRSRTGTGESVSAPHGRRPGRLFRGGRLRLRGADRCRARVGVRNAGLAEPDVHVTCDGIVPDGFRATDRRRQRAGRRRRQRPPYYDHYDIRSRARPAGTWTATVRPDTVVLLECSPTPSNYSVQEVQVFSSTGRLLGALPSPRTLEGDAPLPPVYDPSGLSVQHREIVAAMTAYGPGDSHASGPSVPLTVRWLFDGRGFVRVSS